MTVSFRELDMLSRQINQAHRGAVMAELSARGIGEIGHPMLLAILESSGRGGSECQCHAQRELAELLHISPAAVANSLKSLEKGGYVHREPGQKDARRNQVLLTEKGWDAVEGCREAFETVARRMLAGFTQEEQAQLLLFRRRMLNNLRGGDPAQSRAKEEP